MGRCDIWKQGTEMLEKRLPNQTLRDYSSCPRSPSMLALPSRLGLGPLIACWPRLPVFRQGGTSGAGCFPRGDVRCHLQSVTSLAWLKVQKRIWDDIRLTLRSLGLWSSTGSSPLTLEPGWFLLALWSISASALHALRASVDVSLNEVQMPYEVSKIFDSSSRLSGVEFIEPGCRFGGSLVVFQESSRHKTIAARRKSWLVSDDIYHLSLYSCPPGNVSS